MSELYSIDITLAAANDPAVHWKMSLPAHTVQLHDYMDMMRLPRDTPIVINRIDIADVERTWLPREASFDQVNYLARKICEAWPDESPDTFAAKLHALIEMEPAPPTMENVLNLACNTPLTTIVGNYDSYASLGRHFLDQGEAGHTVSMEECEAEGLRRAKEQHGVIVDSQYIVRDKGEIRQVHDEQHVTLMAAEKPDGIFSLCLKNPNNPESMEWLDIPAKGDAILAVTRKLGLENPDDCVTSYIECPYMFPLDGIYAEFGIKEMCELADTIQEVMDKGYLLPFKARLSCEDAAGSPAWYQEQACGVETFELHTDVRSDRELTLKYMKKAFGERDDVKYEQIDPERVGEFMRKHFRYESTPYGYFRVPFDNERLIAGSYEPEESGQGVYELAL